MRFELAKFRDRPTPAVLPRQGAGRRRAQPPVHRRQHAPPHRHHGPERARRSPIAGTGEPGKADGAFAEAQFDDPQGMALDGDTLYVADRKNHLIRALDLKAGRSRTVAGTGEQDRRAAASGGDGPEDRPEQPVGPAAHRPARCTSPWPGITRSGRSTSTRMRVAPYAGNGRREHRATARWRARELRPAERPGDRRQDAVRRRQRGQRHPRGRR